MLTLKEISKRYGRAETPAVKGVSLEVARGEILALVGESGSGKTTLLRLVAGLETPDEGGIAIDGERVAESTGNIWVPPEKRRVGLVFQDGALFPHLTVAQNAGYGLSRREHSRIERAAIVDEMLAMTGLSEYRARFPHQLSGGERQRLAVARALAPRPKLILLDEPFSNLDPALRRSIREEILEILRKADITAVIVTHDTDDALAIGDRVAVFQDGKIAQVGTPEEIYRNPKCGYCARLFGPANRFQPNGSDSLVWIRPEKMHLSFDPEGKESAIPVRVRHSRDGGRHVEAIVDCADPKLSGGESWTLFLEDMPREISEGTPGWVQWEKD